MSHKRTSPPETMNGCSLCNLKGQKRVGPSTLLGRKAWMGSCLLPASHTYSTGPRARQKTEAWPDSPCLLVAPKNHQSPEDCSKWLHIKSSLWQPHRHGEQRCTKPIWGLCSGPLASTAWLACKAVGQDLMLWLSTAMLCRSYKRKQRISQQEDYCKSPF